MGYTTSLERWLPRDALRIVQILRDHGHQGWVVGGCVRDCLRADMHDSELRPEDWDIATDAQPDEVVSIFRKVIPTGIQHGTVTVMMNRIGYEVTTLRAEHEYTDGRRPGSVMFVKDIEDDLSRRDFTVNAIAYDPLRGTLIDPFGGIADLKGRVLKAVGQASERFTEDGLRVLRAARFVATLGFDLDAQTEAAIQPSLDSYRKVSAERIREEWLKAMKARQPSRAFSVMKDHGMLAITAPELMEAVGCEQNRYHEYDVWGHTMACMDACPRSAVLRMAGLLHDVGKPRSRAFSEKTRDYTFYNHESIGAAMANPMLQRLRFSNADRQHIVGLVRHHLICYDESWSDSAVRRWLRRVTPELAEDLYLLGRADAMGKGRDARDDVENIERLRARVEELVAAGAAVGVRDLAISGRDLISKVGLKPGPIMGEILRQLLEEVTEDPQRNETATLLRRAKEIADTASARSN